MKDPDMANGIKPPADKQRAATDTERLNRLLEMASDAHKVELKILHNARARCLKAVHDKPTAAHMRDLEAATAVLNEAIGRLWALYYPEDERFKNLIEVHKYLRGLGYKISRGKLYKDAANKQIRVQPGGSVLKRDADAYSKTLKYLGDPLKGLEAAQARRAELENRKLEQQIKTLEFDLKIKEGQYVHREEADMARAALISFIKANLTNMVHTMAINWIAICRGDPAQSAAMVEAELDDIADLLNKLAKVDEFELVS